MLASSTFTPDSSGLTCGVAGVCAVEFRNVSRLHPDRHHGWAGGPEHSAAIKRGMARAKERFDRDAEVRARYPHPRCKHCDGPVVESYTGRRRLYCSDACRRAAYRERKRARLAELAAHPHRCWHCDAPVEEPHTGRWRKYCSDACRQADYRTRRWVSRG
jgi:endogenous inhibitor of DNA gyrase (YacG/DUF329 family)